jgi:eukaryotic-like serine/threonine-protein kinase
VSAENADTGAHFTNGADHPTAPAGQIPLVSGPDPTVLGDFRVVRKIGEGGMGSVYLAEDTKLGRMAALKTMKPELAASGPERDRFLREARAAAAIDHDNVVPVWQVGEASDGTPFIAMPFLQGEMLDSRLKREPVSGLGRIIKVGRAVADGLAAAHAKGLIHRDIKPGNIWLEGDPGAADLNQQIRRVKILDFGLARSVEKSDIQITASGAVLGTPAYMAPEQAKGEPLDARSDLFSLGATLFRMAVGRLPFAGPTPMAVMIALTTEELPPVKTLAPNLPSALASLIDRLLCKKPDGRPQSAAEVSAALRQFVKDAQTKKLAPSAPVAPQPVAPRRTAPADISTSLPRPIPAVPGAEATDVPEPPGKAHAKPQKPKTAKPAPVRWPLIAGAAVAVLVVVLGIWLAVKPRENPPVPDTIAEKKDVPSVRRDPSPSPPPAPITKADVKPSEPPKPPAITDPDRIAAEYVLSIGGVLTVQNDESVIRDVKDLPPDPFQLWSVDLNGNKLVTDEGLACFRKCRGMGGVNLKGALVTNIGLGHFVNNRNLYGFNLVGTAITDEGLKPFANHTGIVSVGFPPGSTGETLKIFQHCEKMNHFGIADTAVTDAGLAQVSEWWPALESVWMLNAKRIGDPGLVHLQKCKKLRSAMLKGTKVTAAGVAALAKALPECRIEWDGGIVGPAAKE